MSTTPWDVYKLILIFLMFLLALIYFYSWQSLTAQGLSMQEMQPWTTTCSQVFFDVINNLLFFQLWWRSAFNGLQLMVELSFWWSNSSHSFGFTQWWRFFSYYCCCAHLVRCGGALGIGIVQFTQLHSSIG